MQTAAGEAVLSHERGQGAVAFLVAALDIVARGRAAEDERTHILILPLLSWRALIQLKGASRNRD